jgi:hypothetical protein
MTVMQKNGAGLRSLRSAQDCPLSLRVLPVISLSGACIHQKTPNSTRFAFAFAENIRTMI